MPSSLSLLETAPVKVDATWRGRACDLCNGWQPSVNLANFTHTSTQDLIAMSARKDSPSRVYVGRLSRDTREKDLQRLFEKYGDIHRIDMKTGFAFVHYEDRRDADDAIKRLDGEKLLGEKIVVQSANGGRSGSDRDRRESMDAQVCFNCGKTGHWARDCTNGDWK